MMVLVSIIKSIKEIIEVMVVVVHDDVFPPIFPSVICVWPKNNRKYLNSGKDHHLLCLEQYESFLKSI